MSRIITFLGQVGVGHTPIAIATAKWFAQRQKRVLLVTHSPNPRADLLLNMPLTAQPQVIAPKLEAVQLQTTVLLEQSWQQFKDLISLYVPIPSFSEEVYPGELIILPGFDSVLAFNALRQYYMSGDYDVIIYNGRGDLETLRLLGVPDVLNWYFHRFRQVFEALDLSKIADSIGGPIASALITANVDTKKIEQEMNRIREWIAQGIAVVNDPQRLTAYLVTNDEPDAIAEARWLWGSAQQVNLRVSGVLASDPQSATLPELKHAFAPLKVNALPKFYSEDWAAIVDALPDFMATVAIPEPLTIDIDQRQVQVFLPGFTKKQVKLTQFGSELTIEAGDQRRNIFLPPEFRGQPIQSGKFEAPYLVVSF
jgi:anion-transporting  ArsA/GET3 family ATPase